MCKSCMKAGYRWMLKMRVCCKRTRAMPRLNAGCICVQTYPGYMRIRWCLPIAHSWLNTLGAHPLGDRIFANVSAQRGVIEVAQLDSGHELYQAAMQTLETKPPCLWARRSVLLVDGQRLLIYECFLPGMDN